MNNLSAKGLAPHESACSSDSITSLRVFNDHSQAIMAGGIHGQYL